VTAIASVANGNTTSVKIRLLAPRDAAQRR
jgi:hypothetical protein